MPIPYSSALRIYAKQSGSGFIIPKKGSKQYEEVKKIQSETEMSAEHAVKKRSKKVKAKAESESDKEADPMAAKTKKGEPSQRFKAFGGETKIKAGVAGDAPEEVPLPKTKPIDVPEGKIKENKIVKRPLKAKPKKELPPEVKVEAQQFIVNENTGPSQTISADYADQKKNIKKELNEKVPKIVATKSKTGNATLDGMVSINPQNISGNAPFDMSALRSKLLF